MKTRLLTFVGLLVCTLHTFAQHPGGVPAPLLWGKTEAAAFRVATTTGTQLFSFKNSNLGWINFNPALCFDGSAPGLHLPLGSSDLSHLTLCTAFRPADTLSERCVWFLEKNARARLLLSTEWLADFEGSRYFRLPRSVGETLVLNTYGQTLERSTEPTSSQTLVLGEQPVLPELPLQSLRGWLPEIVVYDRRLTPEQEQRVETYLALKYGLTLPQTYLNATGTVIWDAQKNAAFHHRIMGIGRDDASSLMQKQSTSSEAPGLLSLSVGPLAASNPVNPIVLPEQTFLICGDNGDLFWPDVPTHGRPTPLLRRWKMAAAGDAPDLATELRFDPRLAVAPPLPQGHIWWLSIDRSGTGTFHPNQTMHIAAAPAKPSEVVVFADVHWDTDGSGADVFSLGIGPALLAQFWADAPVCSTGADGRLHLGAVGGLPPYHFTVQGLGTDFQRQWVSETTEPTVLEGIKPGEYTLTLRDATGRIFEEKAYIQSADAPMAALSTRYWLHPDEPLHLSAAPSVGSAADITYEWTGPQGFLSRSAEVNLAKAGPYQLIMERAGCASRHDFEVLATSDGPFRSLLLLPNPVAADGDFQLFIELDRAASVEVLLTDETGRIQWSTILRGSDRYAHMGRANVAAGTYQITLRCEEMVRSLPLVVTR